MLGVVEADAGVEWWVLRDQINWMQASAAHLGRVQERLQEMAELAERAIRKGCQKHLDEEFQEGKCRLSKIIDGLSGRHEPEARLGELPLFLGYSPHEAEGVNLYTRFQGGRLSVPFAEHIWGADNHLFHEGSERHFRPLTTEERSYRRTHGIPTTNLFPQTSTELKLRRESNLFDPDFGGLFSSHLAERMHTQIRRAMNQIAVLAGRCSSEFAAIQVQVEQLPDRRQAEQWIAEVADPEAWLKAHL
jgi:hypothetical protein